MAKADAVKGWLTPAAAIALVGKAIGPDRAKTILYEHMRGGMIRTACKWISTEASGDVALGKPGPHFLKPESWAHLQNADFWETGFARFFIPAAQLEDAQTLRCFDVLLEPIGVRESVPAQMVKPEEGEPSSVSPTIERRGRLRKEFWDDLLIAIFKKIYDGDLKPKTQADIERAMLQWVTENGHELGDSAVRAPARKLFKALQE
jgi:hypothetical protein